MRVLALVTDAFGGHGGIAEYNRHLLASLTRSDCVREVIVLPRLAATSLEQLPSGMRQLRPVKGRLAYSLAALRTVLSTRVDIVFCGHLFMVPAAAAIAKLVRAPLWVQVHGVEAWTRLSAVHRRSVETAVLVTAVSRYTRRRLLEWVGIDPTRVKVLPNTVDRRFSPAPKPARLLDRYNAWDKQILLT